MTKNNNQREKILDTARDLFAEKGFEATTTRELNKTIGIADGLLYYYFPEGKQEILDTIVQESFEQRLVALKIDFSNVETIQQLESSLIQFVEGIWSYFTSEDNYQSFLITVRERMMLSDEESDWLEKVFQQIEDNICQSLIDISPQFNWKSEDAEVRGKLCTSVIQSKIYSELLLKDNRELTKEIEQSIEQQIIYIFE